MKRWSRCLHQPVGRNSQHVFQAQQKLSASRVLKTETASIKDKISPHLQIEYFGRFYARFFSRSSCVTIFIFKERWWLWSASAENLMLSVLLRLRVYTGWCEDPQLGFFLLQRFTLVGQSSLSSLLIVAPNLNVTPKKRVEGERTNVAIRKLFRTTLQACSYDASRK